MTAFYHVSVLLNVALLLTRTAKHSAAFVVTRTKPCPLCHASHHHHVDPSSKRSNHIFALRNAISNEDYDAIIIGSGMGSLVAGNILVAAGRSVLMLESHSIPGGFTTNFYRKGFRFECSTHMIPGCERGGAVGDLLHDLHLDDSVEFIQLKELMRWIDPSRGIDCLVPMSLQQHIKLLCDLFPDQESGIKKFYHIYYPIVEFVQEYKQRRGLDQIVYSLTNIPTLVRLLMLKDKTAADILDPLVTDAACRDMMTIMTLIFGLDYTELDAPIFLFGSMGHFASGAYYPKGGSGALSEALANRFRKLGGELHLRSHVDEILFEDNRATGVCTTDHRGHITTAKGHCIVVGCDTNAMVKYLCPPGVLPERYVKSIVNRVPGPSSMMVWVGLDLDLREHGITSYQIIQNNAVQQTPELLDYIAHTADYSRLPSTDVSIYSNIDPSCCPPGKSVILSIFVASEEPFQQALGPNNERGANYKALKERIGQQFLGHMSEALDIPELAKYAEVVEVATPITLKRYTGHRQGSFMGWRLTPDQGAFSSQPGQPPVSGLFTCGQWVGFGGVPNVMTTGLEAGRMTERFLQKASGAQTTKS